MAGKGQGPAPKPAHLRQRRNKKSGAATLSGRTRLHVPRDQIPELFDRPCPCGGIAPPARRRKRAHGRKPNLPKPCNLCLGTGIIPWHPLTMAWWRDVWTSEVHDEYLIVDRQGLRRLAVLVEQFWRASDGGLSVRELAAEIRLQQACFGLTPLDRSRLQWEIEHPPAEAEKTDDAPPEPMDSRKVLRALG